MVRVGSPRTLLELVLAGPAGWGLLTRVVTLTQRSHPNSFLQVDGSGQQGKAASPWPSLLPVPGLWLTTPSALPLGSRFQAPCDWAVQDTG